MNFIDHLELTISDEVLHKAYTHFSQSYDPYSGNRYIIYRFIKQIEKNDKTNYSIQITDVSVAHLNGTNYVLSIENIDPNNAPNYKEKPMCAPFKDDELDECKPF